MIKRGVFEGRPPVSMCIFVLNCISSRALCLELTYMDRRSDFSMERSLDVSPGAQHIKISDECFTLYSWCNIWSQHVSFSAFASLLEYTTNGLWDKPWIVPFVSKALVSGRSRTLNVIKARRISFVLCSDQFHWHSCKSKSVFKWMQMLSK